MLTEEQIKSLKPGDPLIMHGTFEGLSPFGNVIIKHREQMLSGISKKSRVYVHPSAVSLPDNSQSSIVNSQSKYDPSRKFKKGDRAKVVERYGRNVTCFPVGRIKVGDIVTVAENESGDVFIKVLTDDGHEMMAPWFMLELVKPVEEMEPYSAREYADFYAVEKDGAQYSIFFKGSYHDNAKAAAEAERDRLNAEYRKEQKCK